MIGNPCAQVKNNGKSATKATKDTKATEDGEGRRRTEKSREKQRRIAENQS
jgi:hypothetical protein